MEFAILLFPEFRQVLIDNAGVKHHFKCLYPRDVTQGKVTMQSPEQSQVFDDHVYDSPICKEPKGAGLIPMALVQSEQSE